jgi:hypothetical protein
MSMISPEDGNIPFAAFREQLDSLILATVNKLEREFPKQPGSDQDSGGLLRCLVLVSNNTYRTMRYFCADIPEDPTRKREYALSATPLARTILEALFTTVFLFEDLPARTAWFQKAGWREYKEFHGRLVTEYGSDPNWQEYTAAIGAFIEESKSWWSITREEESGVSKIKRWPIPSRMAQDSNTSEERRRFMMYLEDWFYRDLSQDAHLSWPGLVRRVGYLLVNRPQEQDFAILQKQKSDAMVDAAIMMLAMISEIGTTLRFGLSERLKYVWGVLRSLGPATEELYKKRYEALLQA